MIRIFFLFYLSWIILLAGVRAEANEIKFLRDADHDGFPEQVVYLKGKEIFKIAIDLDKDSRPERFEFFKQGKLSRIEYDRDHDGVVEEIVFFSQGLPVKTLKKTSKGLETFFWDPKGTLLREEWDKDADGHPEVTFFFKKGMLEKKSFDKDENGVPEKIVFFKKGQVFKILEDRNQDRIPDVLFLYQKGRLVSEKLDTNYNGHYDTFYTFKQNCTKIKRDLDEDGLWDQEEISCKKKERKILFYHKGKVFKQEYYKKGHLFSLEVDKDLDGFFEWRAFYNKRGYLFKVQEWSPKKGCIAERFYSPQGKIKKAIFHKGPGCLILYYQKGRLVKLDEDIDGNGLWEREILYKKEKKFVSLDTNHDGKWDTWEIWKGKKLLSVKRDLDGDGSPDINEEVRP